MSASGSLAFFASRTSYGAENPPLFTAVWQFWQRSTVSAPHEFFRPEIQYCSISGHLPWTLSIRFSRSAIGFSKTSICAWALSLRSWKPWRARVVCLWCSMAFE